MAVKIRLKRLGKIRAPYYRIIVIDAHAKRDGRPIEEIGKYAPKEDPSFIEVDSERVQHWLSVGAQPTEPVQAILRKTGDWQRFKGLPPPAPLEVAESRPDKKAVFEEAAKEAQAEGEQTKQQTKQQSKQQSKSKKSASKKSESGKGAEDTAPATSDQAAAEQPEATAQEQASSGDGQTESAGSEGHAEPAQSEGRAQSGEGEGKTESQGED